MRALSPSMAPLVYPRGALFSVHAALETGQRHADAPLAAVRTGHVALGRGRQVLGGGLVVLVARAVARAVVRAWELNRPDVTAARPSPSDMHPAVPQPGSEGTEGIVIRSSCSKVLDFACHFPDDGSWFQHALSHEPAPHGRHQVRYPSPWNRIPYKSCLQFFRLTEPHRSP
jgi:hypothetical protein